MTEEERTNETAGPEPSEGGAGRAHDAGFGDAMHEAAAGREAGEDTVESLRNQLAELLAEKDQQLAAWQRTQADFANFRRRIEQERIDLIHTAEAGLIRELLPVLDDLERALVGLPPELLDLNWIEGIVFIERKLRAVLDLHGLQPIDALGKEFDPYEHEAIVREGEPGGTTVVTAELQRGYRLHDRVLRPTLVKVGTPTNTKSE